MFRIDDPSAALALPTPEAAGTEGFFFEGNPGSGIPATLVRASFLNMLQEEIRAVVVAGGLTPSKTTYNQLLNAIKAVATGQFTHLLATPGYIKFPDGLILQWGTISFSGASSASATLPITFPTSSALGFVTNPNTTVFATTTSISTTTINAATSGSGTFNVPYLAIGY